MSVPERALGEGSIAHPFGSPRNVTVEFRFLAIDETHFREDQPAAAD
jgi:hypothetical protein